MQVTWRWWDQAGLNFGQEDRRVEEWTGEREVDAEMAAVKRRGKAE